MGSYKWMIGSVTVTITHIGGPITRLITTHKPPSMNLSADVLALSALRLVALGAAAALGTVAPRPRGRGR